MKKLLCLVFAFLFVCACASAEQTIPQLAPLFDTEPLEKYAGFNINEETGDWTLYDNTTSAALRAIRNGALSGASDGVFFYLEVQGNRSANTLLPVLTFVRVGNTAQNTCAVSVFCDNVRYDIAVTCESATFGAYKGEIMRAPLSKSNFAMLDEIENAEEVRVFLHGDTGYLTTLKKKSATSVSQKERIERAGLDCLSLRQVINAMGFDAYGFKARDFANWEKTTGVTPRIERVDMDTETIATGKDIPKLPEKTHLLTTRVSGSDVTLLTKKLLENGSQFTAASSSYGIGTRACVKELQQYYGLLVTGSVDSKLLNLLFADEIPAAAKAEETEWDYTAIGKLSFAPDGYTFTRETASVTCVNTDNVLLTVTGHVLSDEGDTISLGWDAKASFLYKGETAFEAQIRCAADDGTRYDTELGALAEADVVLAAEVPARVAQESGWQLAIEYDGETAVFDLE